ncbi:hypothetical protein B7494_g1720 [Chlorociboria aeruginascens]|nr:hypothetical protein B7494_g1720 [Chlorociboria aeruginascens]
MAPSFDIIDTASPSIEKHVLFSTLKVTPLLDTPYLTAMILTLPPLANGPPPHFHRLSSTSFYIIRGTVSFTIQVPSASTPQVRGQQPQASSSTPLASPQAPIQTQTHATGPCTFLTLDKRAKYTFSNPYAAEAEMLVLWAPGGMTKFWHSWKEMESRERRALNRNEIAGLMAGFGVVLVGQEGVGEEEDEDKDLEDFESGLKCMA